MPKKNDTQTLVLLDAHAILHRAYHALPDFASPSGEPTGALYGVVAMLIKIVEELKPDYIAACYDLPEPTYRHEAYAEYKAGRAKTDDSLVAQIIRSRDIFTTFGIPIYEQSGFEADDILGTIAAQTKSDTALEVIIASGDMDTLQLVDKKRVRVYTLRKGIKDTIMYDEATVKERFGFPPKLVPDYKGLRGDPSDNIPGIAGIGEKTATELITQFGAIEKIYTALEKKNGEETFLAAGIKKRIIGLLQEGKEEAEFSKMLATIRTDAAITFERPEKTWRENLDLEAVHALFGELGFRTLGTRVQQLFGEGASVGVASEAPRPPEREITEAAIALWLLQSDTTNPSYEDIIDYGRAQYTTSDFATIKKELLIALKTNHLLDVYETIELPLIAVVEKMNAAGITLDTAYLKQLSAELHGELEKLEQDIYREAGSEFNINSPKQLGDILYDVIGLKPKNAKRTATGQRSTKESELEKMRDDHPIITHILRYRELQKLVSTYIDNLPGMVGEDGRLRTTFIQTGTTTGRMASKDPNLQNIPIRSVEGKAVRKGFVAAPGHQLVAIDYSQIELRIAAMLSADPALLDIFRRGEDVHTGVAVRVFKVDAEEVTSEMRRKAKVINFGILYGMGVNALRANLGAETTRAEAQEFLNAYFATFTRLAEYLEETKEFARKHGYTETMFGRRRSFPGITSSAPFIRAQAERMAINAPIQGTEGDILRIAMLEVQAYFDREQFGTDARMLLQVHDELMFEIKTELIDTVVPQLVIIMKHVFAGKETHDVPVEVDVEVGENWGELREL